MDTAGHHAPASPHPRDDLDTPSRSFSSSPAPLTMSPVDARPPSNVLQTSLPMVAVVVDPPEGADAEVQALATHHPPPPPMLPPLSAKPDTDKALPPTIMSSPGPIAGPSRISLPPVDNAGANMPGPSRRNTHSPHGSRVSPVSPQPTAAFARLPDALLRERDERRAISSLGHGALPDDKFPAHPVRALSYDARVRRQASHVERRNTQSEAAYERPYERPHTGGTEERPRTALYDRGAELFGQRSGLDWIVPPGPTANADGDKRASSLSMMVSTATREKAVGERLLPTLAHAKAELTAYAMKARLTGYSLNACIGLQVLLGAMTTGVAAATTGKSASIAVSVLGGLSTLAASYLARARGSGEPEASTARCKDLENFIRECEAFVLDRGHIVGADLDHEIEKFRRRFEEIMGNASSVPIPTRAPAPAPDGGTPGAPNGYPDSFKQKLPV